MHAVRYFAQIRPYFIRTGIESNARYLLEIYTFNRDLTLLQRAWHYYP
jgi:hypothetical protein